MRQFRRYVSVEADVGRGRGLVVGLVLRYLGLREAANGLVGHDLHPCCCVRIFEIQYRLWDSRDGQTFQINCKLGCPLELLVRLCPKAWGGVPADCSGEHLIAGRLRPHPGYTTSAAQQRL